MRKKTIESGAGRGLKPEFQKQSGLLKKGRWGVPQVSGFK
jgi:hypothetical protein